MQQVGYGRLLVLVQVRRATMALVADAGNKKAHRGHLFSYRH
jgi:hypothetical protein